MFKQTSHAVPQIANKKSRLTEPQLANKKPRLSADAVTKPGPDKSAAQTEQQPNTRPRPVGSYERPWRAAMKAPGSKSSSKTSSKEEQQAEISSAVNTSKKPDPVKKLQVDADIWCHTGHLFATSTVSRTISVTLHALCTCIHMQHHNTQLVQFAN